MLFVDLLICCLLFVGCFFVEYVFDELVLFAACCLSLCVVCCCGAGRCYCSLCVACCALFVVDCLLWLM